MDDIFKYVRRAIECIQWIPSVAYPGLPTVELEDKVEIAKRGGVVEEHRDATEYNWKLETAFDSLRLSVRIKSEDGDFIDPVCRRLALAGSISILRREALKSYHLTFLIVNKVDADQATCLIQREINYSRETSCAIVDQSKSFMRKCSN